VGFLNKQGKFAIRPQFGQAGPFHEGLAIIRIGGWDTGTEGFIDRHGKIVITPQIEEAQPFSEELAAVRIGDKWGYVAR
jgi:hypothetical protein